MTVVVVPSDRVCAVPHRAQGARLTRPAAELLQVGALEKWVRKREEKKGEYEPSSMCYWFLGILAYAAIRLSNRKWYHMVA